jgi:RimJ/RimL family protein N-acetyltransferase
MSDSEEIHKYNLCYLSYNENSTEQRKFLDECETDKDLASFAFESQNTALWDEWHGEAYLVKDLNIDEYVGVCIIRPAPYDQNTIPRPMSICYGILSSYRNKGYATMILKEIVRELFLNRNHSKIALEIEATNHASHVVASKAGFKIDFEYSKIFEKEGYDYVALSLSKQDYEKVKVKS